MTEAASGQAWNRLAPWAAWLVVLGALLASATSLGNAYALDDLPVIQGRELLHSLESPWRLLTATYWDLPPQGTLWRPLGLLGFALQWAVADGAPWVFHTVNVLLYLGITVVVYRLARALMPMPAALLAGLVFAVHPVHVESVGNVVGQLELWVALAIVTATALYVEARRRGPLGVGTIVALLACYAVGLGMKEHALLLPAFFAAAELTVLRAEPRRGEAAQRLRFLAYGLVLLAAVWLVLRTEIVGELAGDRAHVALRGLGLWDRSWLMLGLVPEFTRLFLWPVRLYSDYSPQLIGLRVEPSLAHLPGALILLAYGAALRWSWRRDPTLAFGLLWIPVSLALVANIVVPTGILLAERTLFLATVGVALALGAGAARLAPRFLMLQAALRTAILAGVAALLIAAAAHSAERQFVWKSNEDMVSTLVLEAPQNFRGNFWLGDELMRRGDLAEGEVALRRAIALWPENDGPSFILALRLQEHGRCDLATDLYATVRRLEPEKPAAYYGGAGCLISARRYREARALALEGLATTGRSARAFRFLIYTADSALVATDSARGPNWWTRKQPADHPVVSQVTPMTAGVP